MFTKEFINRISKIKRRWQHRGFPYLSKLILTNSEVALSHNTTLKQACFFDYPKYYSLPSTIFLSNVHFTSKMTCFSFSKAGTSIPSNFL